MLLTQVTGFDAALASLIFYRIDLALELFLALLQLLDLILQRRHGIALFHIYAAGRAGIFGFEISEVGNFLLGGFQFIAQLVKAVAIVGDLPFPAALSRRRF